MLRLQRSPIRWVVGAGLAAYAANSTNSDTTSENIRHSFSKVTSCEPAKDGSTWDSDWDMRKKNKNKVVHQIVMVRHGQYDREGKTDAENILTATGRQQAEATGKRIDTLIKSGQIAPVKTMYFSTMARATETCQLILPHISQSISPPVLASTSTAVGTGSTAVDVPSTMRVEACSMIREGAVCRPVPPCTGWDPSEEDFEKEGARVLAAFKNHVHRAEEEEENNYSTVLVCHVDAFVAVWCAVYICSEHLYAFVVVIT